MTPVAIILATLTFFIWNYVDGYEKGLIVALSVLLIACPCALGLATPLTLWLSLERATESGVVLRSTAALERLAKVINVFFDKTGTLTQLPMKVHEIYVDESFFTAKSAKGAKKEEKEDSLSDRRVLGGSNGFGFIQLVASIENESEHPLAKAIVEYAKLNQVEFAKPKSFKAIPAMGVIAKLPFTNYPIAIGSARLMNAEALKMSTNISEQATAWKEAGHVVVYVGWEGQVVGLVGLGETVRAEAKDVVHQLQSRGLNLGVLTGDDESAGARWQNVLGIPVQAALTPDEKMKRLAENAAMIGDGINDGPALAAATVGLAMNHGTDVARTAADIVLMRDDLKVIPWLVDLSRESMKRVKQNLGWAVIYNLIGVALAMAGLLQPVFSAFAMVASSIFVTSNAMKMNKFPLLEEDT
jgi:cation transport ATPase